MSNVGMNRGPWPPQAEGVNHLPDHIGLRHDGVDLFRDRDGTVATQQRKSAVEEFPFFNGKLTWFNAVALDILNAVDQERSVLDRDLLAWQPYHPLDDEIVSIASHHNVGSLWFSRAVSELVHQEQITRSKGWLHARTFHDDQPEINPQNQQAQKQRAGKNQTPRSSRPE